MATTLACCRTKVCYSGLSVFHSLLSLYTIEELFYSDVLVQIVDARNPLLFRCEDLEHYVKEVDKKKLNLILCNKADFLTHEQRRFWAKYFDSINASVVFFSALQSTEQDDEVENEVCM